MTDSHDSPPLTRRELRERERLNALAGRDPSWQPEDGPTDEKVEPAGRSSGAPAGADAASTRDQERNEPQYDPPESEAEAASGVQGAPVTSYAEYRGATSAQRAEPAADSPFAPVARAPKPERPTGGVEPRDAEQTMTRRQLRELYAQRLAESAPEAAEPSTEILADEPLRAAGVGDPEADDPTAGPASAEPEWRAPALPATEFLDQDSMTSEPVSSAPGPEPETVVLPPSQSDEAAAGQAPAGQAATDEDPDKPHTRSFQPPTGHWSIAANQEEQPSFEDIIAGPADTSGYGLTSSSLVLSSIPTRDAAWSAMGKSGEALKTGSVELPEALSSTGEHARFDTSALDRMFDEEEVRVDTAMVHAPGSEPVRASRAVSSLTPTGDLVSTSTKTSHRLPMALAISAGALAVGVVGLFAAGAILGFF